MKLHAIRLDEAGVNRREFLKRSGGTLVSLLTSRGLSPETAQQVAQLITTGGGGKPVGILYAHYPLGHYGGPLEELADNQQLFNQLLNLRPGARPRQLDAAGELNPETISYGMTMDSDSLQQLLSDPKFRVVDMEDGEIGISDGDYEYYFSAGQDMLDQFRQGTPIKDVIKTAWEAAGKWYDPDQYASMDWYSDVPELMRLAKIHRLSPPGELRSWAEFPGAIRDAVKNWELELEQDDLNTQAQRDRQSAADHRASYRTRTDLPGGMHQDYDEFLEQLQRLCAPLSEAAHGGQVEIGWADPEQDWEIADQVDQIFQRSGIRPDRSKQLGPVALLNGEPIGGLLYSWQRDPEQDAQVFSFDVAVDQPQRGAGRPHAGLGGSGQAASAGLRLVQAGLELYQQEREAYGDRTMISLYVVNPKLARYLERNLGFEVETEYGHGAAQLVRY